MLTTLNSELLSTNHISALQMCLSCHWCTCWETLCFFLQVYQILVSFCLHWYHSVSNFCHGNIVVIFVTDSCVFCMLSVLVNSLWVSAEDLMLLLFTVMIHVCVFWIIQVQCWRLSGSDLLRSVRSAERSSAPAAGPPAGGGDGQTGSARGSSRPGQPLFSSHTAGRHEGPLTFSSLWVVDKWTWLLFTSSF